MGSRRGACPRFTRPLPSTGAEATGSAQAHASGSPGRGPVFVLGALVLEQDQEQDDDHGAGPVLGVPCSAGRVRPSGSSLNGCEQKFAAAVLLACSLACLLALRVLARFACSCFCNHNGAGLVRKGTAAPRNLD